MEVQLKPFQKVTEATAADICARVALSAEATAFLLPDLSPQAYLSLLLSGEHYADAVRFLAFALPAREGVWWACVTTRVNLPGDPPAPVLAALQAAEAWVFKNEDSIRHQCLSSAEALRFEGAASYAALAAFWSGGSLAPEGSPEVLPDPSLCPIGVGAAILLAVTPGDSAGLKARFEDAIGRGMNIANGGNGDSSLIKHGAPAVALG